MGKTILDIIPNKHLYNTSHLFVLHVFILYFTLNIAIIMYLFVFAAVLVGWDEIWVIITILII